MTSPDCKSLINSLSFGLSFIVPDACYGNIDLENNEIRRGNAHPVPFRVEAFARRCLLDGVDALGWLQSKLPDIEAFEASRESETV